MVISVVGSGGKTTLIHKLAEEYRAQGRKVFVTTSTHMLIEEDTILGDDAEEIINVLNKNGYVMAGIPEGCKIQSLSMDTYYKVCSHADVILVEADGSKSLPIKYPNEKEPVIYENTDEIYIVCGIFAVGHPIREVAFRLDLVLNCLGVKEEDILTKEHVRKLLKEGYMDPLSEKYPHKKLHIYPTGGNLY